ncbi:hypothetical protein BUL40_02625 [Croceivirga radicis]|uniref:Viral A-type inclusion protein n=1 Tax=Croceivirga radicis TaxID=1929488 RepID=A0A1V6LWH5_9FLAO|nr:hypothetical protein [Croceivirga radicis]OQD44465.1 hypothetical protein BUL40_02625 [Croceivirga radicis]
MKKIVFLFISLVFFACNEKKEETNTKPTQMQTVMAIHDEVMPKMGKLGRLVGQLKEKVDTTAQSMVYQEAMKDLQEANMAMMDWMKGFGDRFDSDEILNGKELSPQKQEWLNEEEVKVKELKEQINSSIARAETLLGQE